MKKLFFIIFIHTTCIAQNPDFKQYLSKNNEVLNLEAESKINMFNTEFYKNSVFLFGENHGASEPHKVDLMLFKQLYREANVRYYIAEIDAAKAWMLNKYLEDGNENWLKKIFKSWVNESAQWANKSNHAKYQRLREFYLSLPAKKRFKIIGIDTVQDYDLLKESFRSLIPTKVKDEALKDLITMIDTVSQKGRKALGAKAREISTNQKSYSADLQYFIKSLGCLGAGMYRDSIMYRNFDNYVSINQLTNQKFYGFLGFFHCLQAGYEKIRPFAAQLQLNKTAFSNQIISLQMFALNTQVLLPYNEQLKKMMPVSYVEKLRKDNPDFPYSEKYVPYELSNDSPMMKASGIEYFKENSTPNSITIFNLNTAESPFKTTKTIAEITGFQTIKFTNPNTVTTDAFQYVILFRNAKAGLPLE